MDYETALRRLADRFTAPLPGSAAHAMMAPSPRHPWPEGFDFATIRPAAGLLLLFPAADRAHIILTIRAHTLERHGGQVSLPGGVIEPGETFEEAALREAHEEIDLDPSRVGILGALTPLDIPVSGFRLHPVVGCAPEPLVLRPAHGEVAAIVDVDVDELLDGSRVVIGDRSRGGRQVSAPVFQAAGVEIWGATAMVLAEFLAMLGWSRQK